MTICSSSALSIKNRSQKGNFKVIGSKYTTKSRSFIPNEIVSLGPRTQSLFELLNIGARIKKAAHPCKRTGSVLLRYNAGHSLLFSLFSRPSLRVPTPLSPRIPVLRTSRILLSPRILILSEHLTPSRIRCAVGGRKSTLLPPPQALALIDRKAKSVKVNMTN